MPGLLGPSSPAPAAEQLRRGGDLGARANHSGVVRCRLRGPSTRILRSGIFTTKPASPDHAWNHRTFPLHCWRCKSVGSDGAGAGPINAKGAPLRQSAGDKCCHVKSLDGAPSTTTKRPKPVSSQAAADWRGGLHQSEMRWTDRQHKQRANNAGACPPLATSLPLGLGLGRFGSCRCVVGRWAPLMLPHLARSDGPARPVGPLERTTLHPLRMLRAQLTPTI